MNQELERTCSALASSGADIAILASVANVTYALGQEVPIPFGAMAELTYGPWLAIIDVSANHCVAIVPNFAVSRFEKENGSISAFGFDTFDSFASSEPRSTYLALIDQALRQIGVSDQAAIALESKAVPAMVANAVQQGFPSAEMIEAESALMAARWIKTDQRNQTLARSRSSGRYRSSIAYSPGANGWQQRDRYLDHAERSNLQNGRTGDHALWRTGHRSTRHHSRLSKRTSRTERRELGMPR